MVSSAPATTPTRTEAPTTTRARTRFSPDDPPPHPWANLTPEQREAREREIRERQEAEQARERAKRTNMLWTASNVPQRHAAALASIDLDAGQWGEARRRITDRLGTGVIVALLGQGGRGKTQLAVAIARAAVERGLPALYVKTTQVFDELLDAQDRGARVDGRQKFERPALLILDELHERHDSAYVDRTLKGIIDARYDSQLDTILIANQDRQAFATSVGVSIAQRIGETGEAIECLWPNFRQRGER